MPKIDQSLTTHVGVVNDWFAPRAPAVVLVWADAKLIGRVGLQVVNDCVAGGAGLVDPLPVPLPVADGVVPEGDEKTWNNHHNGNVLRWEHIRVVQGQSGVPQGSILGLFIYEICTWTKTGLLLYLGTSWKFVWHKDHQGLGSNSNCSLSVFKCDGTSSPNTWFADSALVLVLTAPPMPGANSSGFQRVKGGGGPQTEGIHTPARRL